MSLAFPTSSFRIADRLVDRPPDAQTRAQGSDSMESNFDQRESAQRLLALVDAREARRAFAARVTEMVVDQHPKLGKLGLAQALVGRWVGLSATTVRRIIRGDSIKLEVETLSACDTAYAAHLTRLERRALMIVEAAERRRRDADARLARTRGPSVGGGGLAGQPAPDAAQLAGRPGRRP